jgi:hypothetical protein
MFQLSGLTKNAGRAVWIGFHGRRIEGKTNFEWVDGSGVSIDL